MRLAALPIIILTTFLTAASGCTSYPPQLPPVYDRGGADGDPDIPVPPTPEDTARTPVTDSATVALLNQSQRAHQSGNGVEAVALVERAIRLSPRQADLWLRLAKLHLQQQDSEAAIQYANKTISLAGQRWDWVQQAWLVIADARDAQGDAGAARKIRSKWQTYRG